jgi:hypothetical protein
MREWAESTTTVDAGVDGIGGSAQSTTCGNERREGLHMWCRPGGRWLQAVEGGEREEKRETREKTDDKGGPTAGVHVSKTSHENHPMVKKNGFESQMVKDF